MNKHNIILVNHTDEYTDIVLVDKTDYYIVTKFHRKDGVVELLPFNTETHGEHHTLKVPLKMIEKNDNVEILESNQKLNEYIAKEIVQARQAQAAIDIAMEKIRQMQK